MKTYHIIIGFIVILFLLNFSYYTHIYQKFHIIIASKKYKLSSLNGNIRKRIFEFNRHKALLSKIKVLENKIMENKYEIGYLKNKNKSRKDIINVFRDIVLKSNVNLKKFELITEESEKETGKVLFKFTGTAKLEDFISLLDMIDNREEFLVVQSYSLRTAGNEKNIFNIDMVLKFVYIIS
jgi:hypothetical protein